ncbi:hypothetical protein NECAME_17658 [Necator americanus]|uniref:Uncharacterized protein n=1 Tax=Necator americanus TaxID=51031 RepID=W2TM32_NECAM|nr:hypothetical protein NECAME_17658 [Necator americanus]ETN82704.1 hypothetical protein NECAME_17658 [Necator americanus]
MNASTRSAAAHLSGRPGHATPGTAWLAGTSFKHEHLTAILDDGLQDSFFEVHAENYMGAGGAPHRALKAIRERYPVSLHGVCMSIGGPVCQHIDQVQEAIGRTMLLENPSTYVAFASSTMSETQFIRAVAQRTGCGLLLDVNNVFVSATNHGYSASTYLADFPLEHVGEIHLAGHSDQQDDELAPLLIDSHDREVAAPVWALYRDVIARTGPLPTLIEWDSQLPSWPELRAQAHAARQIMAGCASQFEPGSDVPPPARACHGA